MKTPQGPPAKAYTAKWLQSAVVSLDIDDKTGKDPYGRWVAVVYPAEAGLHAEELQQNVGRGWPGMRLGFQQLTSSTLRTGVEGGFRLASAPRER
jgi:hypothetical protein